MTPLDASRARAEEGGDFLAAAERRLREARERLEEVRKLLSDPAVVRNQNSCRDLGRELSRLEKLLEAEREHAKARRDLADSRAILEEGADDPEFLEMVSAEIPRLEAAAASWGAEFEELLLPADEQAERDIIVEIRAGTGGEEAALFAADLYRMYARYAERKGLCHRALDTHPAAGGGVKEVVFQITGPRAFGVFRYESGVHRVQRVPETESQGRIHTSAATVAVLPEAEEVEVRIDPADIRVDVYRSSGPGGQSVNTTDSAVRITHVPTGIVVSCQDEKSQHKNKASALKVLRARLYEKMRAEREAEQAAARKEQIKTGDRSEKIRTYNYPQNRVTDHRINFSTYRLEEVLDGDLDELVERSAAADRLRRLTGPASGRP
ncbi:MAG TPA: peptide chain release factor 1 [bacterium]|nr:peptide chain release factor 1 [bacterium]HPQ67224.1 peptide chain release factor 1 [bacterium]